MRRRPPQNNLFPYTTLFRARAGAAAGPPEGGARSAQAFLAIRTTAAAATVSPARWVPDSRSRSTTWASTTVLAGYSARSEEHTSELQSRQYLVCRLLLEKKK